MYELLQGDCREVLAGLPAESVHCVVTSPPYFGLRDYGTARWEGGDEGCDHQKSPFRASDKSTLNNGKGVGPLEKIKNDGVPYGDICGKCGARRIDSQLGLESTPDEYVANMVAVFREVRRVLRKDGTCWLNLGDSYNGSGGAGGDYYEGGLKEGQPRYPGRSISDLKRKDLIGIPWRVAFALQADGWVLRSEIVWAKPNPMPESVTDRPTKAHEQVFLLTKSARYYYDAEAIKEPATATELGATGIPFGGIKQTNGNGNPTYSGNEYISNGTRNRRSVWTITTKPYSEAHFATMPPDLVEPCILAGTSAKGVCPDCGAPWERVTETEHTGYLANGNRPAAEVRGVSQTSGLRGNGRDHKSLTSTTGWRPTCTCGREPVAATVLDPFAGSGTTLAVAQSLGRNSIGIELSHEYIELAHRRILAEQPALFGI